ncbi:hypothetical protein [Variovorax paradoxus]|uniref:Dynamin GTPase effector n=1 Tax=Variovorax paradoxus (strain EPS) TaxID=595537 RepID=E6V6L4_VARPE|nr:hypothetical protein [Variovorax paradoxus]ADU34877.1 Dynamin GTPase effector [Variovorax paradoxus EPS]
MQRISRFYLGHCGYRTAWFDGEILPLTDPITDAPTDAILHLENGGGKTTLMSLIFSCFETEQNKFLKHLQEANNRFSQYFDQTGIPGFIAVEWVLPSRTAKGKPIRLVVGQAVSVRATVEPADVDRIFFSFQEQADLRLENLPAPRLGPTPAASLAEVSRWLQEQKAANPDVFFVKNQAEWKRHLQVDRLIDLEMLQMQVGFSAQEGGFDAFIRMKNESEFIHRFFSLTLDTTRADEARKLVVEVCEKHSRKPEYQARHSQLTLFRSQMSTFADASRAYLDSVAQQGQIQLQGALTSLALQKRQVTSAEAEKEHRREEQLQLQIRQLADAEGGRLAREYTTALHVLHQKKQAMAKFEREAADKQVNDLQDKERFVRAAVLQKDILACEQRIKDLEAVAEAQAEGLKPIKDHAEVQGSLLRAALFLEETRLTRLLQDLTTKQKIRHDLRGTLGEARDDADRKERALAQEQSNLNGAEARRAQRLDAFVAEGLIESVERDASAAAVNWQHAVVQHQRDRESHHATRRQQRETAKQLRRESRAETERAVQLEQDVRRLQELIAQGEHAREALSQHPALTEAAEADLADPFSPILHQRLATLVASYSRQIATIDVRYAELNLTKSAIESTGVAGAGAEVAHVVRVLRDAGVRSARPFNEYLAETIKDAERSRALVQSDPGRFLGVCVARTEFEKAAGVAWTGRLPRKPVTVSVASLDPAAPQADRCVVVAEDDSAFNTAAAAQLAPKLAAAMDADSQERKALEKRYERCVKAQQELESFLATYGEGRLAEAHAKEQVTAEDSQATRARAASLDEDAVRQEAAAEESEEKARQSEEQRAAAAEAMRRVEEFIRDHDAGRAQRLHRLGELPALIAAAEEDRAAAVVELEELMVEESTDATVRAEETVKRDGMATERGQIEYYDKNYDAAKHLKEHPRALDILRGQYKDAASIYRTKEEDVLGKLHEKLQSERDKKTEKANQFAKTCKGVTATDMKPYLHVDHDAVLRETSSEMEQARGTQVDKKTIEQLAIRDAERWYASNKSLVNAPPNPAIVAMGVDDLQGEVARLDELHRVEVTRSETAIEAGKRARLRAEEKKSQADMDQNADQMLCGALGLTEQTTVVQIVAETHALTGLTLDAGDPVVLEQPAAAQVAALGRSYGQKGAAVKKLGNKAREEFDDLKQAAASPDFAKADAAVAQQMQVNSFEDTCRAAEKILTALDDRISTTKSTLDTMQADFDACIEEVTEVVRIAISTLNKATSSDKRVPAGAPYIGGKQVLRMRANFSNINTDLRKQRMRDYLDILAASKAIPVTGTDLISESVMRVYGAPLGIQMLKMSVEETEQYVVVDRISNSGGEGVVMAMFLYLLINELRAENYASVQKSAGGPLLLDNPFAKVTSGAMWKAQRLLAASMGVQLIFATAVEDYNALAEFNRFVRLRKAGPHTGTRRWHLEVANYTFTPKHEEAPAT